MHSRAITAQMEGGWRGGVFLSKAGALQGEAHLWKGTQEGDPGSKGQPMNVLMNKEVSSLTQSGKNGA